MTEAAAKRLGEGLAWFGFWIGLGLFNFQGCKDTPAQVKQAVGEIKTEIKTKETSP